MTDDATIDIPIPDHLEESYREAAEALLQNRPLRGWTSSRKPRVSPLSASEIETLRKVGLSAEPWEGELDRDPLTRTVIDYAALLNSSLSTSEVAKMLGVDSSRVRQRADASSLFGIRDGGQWRFPRFQFERKRPLPGLAEVLAVMPSEISPLDVAEWFLTSNADLEIEAAKGKDATDSLSPREWLLRGYSPRKVAILFKHL